MSQILPSGIEASLKEAGFSPTEILVFKKLVEEGSLTLRELAGKTGKSTGILDTSMKKLLNKGIVKREVINEQPRYVLHSLEAVARKVQEDILRRQETLTRRHRDFESFIGSIGVDKHRPDMEHFQGEEGIKQAYNQLLESGEEFLTLTPVLWRAEDDPLRAFRVEYFRKRQYRKIFQRVLAPDTPLARRFQSRDPFEYRKTLLVPESEHPVTFEKTIVDGTIACIDFTAKTACFLRYPDLAKAERAAFESLWARSLAAERGEATPAIAQKLPPAPTVIPAKTRFLSRFREFILSGHSIVLFTLFALLSAGITFGLYKSAHDMNLQRIRDKAISIAATGALQFDPKDIEAVHTPADITKPEYAKLIATLNLIRRSNEGVKWAYIWRATNDPNQLTFVADADSLNPYAVGDINGNGKIDEADALSAPGDLYDISPYPWTRDAFQKPIADPYPTTDQWGTFIAGVAPIKNDRGETIALFGVDTLAIRIDELTARSFTPVYVFVGLFLLFVLVRFTAINRPLMKELIHSMNLKRVLFGSTVIFLILVGLFYGLYRYTLGIVIEETGQRLMAIAATAATQFDPKDLDQLHWARDMKTEAYQRVFRRLNKIRDDNSEIYYAYIMRPTENVGLVEFVADADSNYNLPHLISALDYSDKDSPTAADENVSPGLLYDDTMDNLITDSLRNPNFRVSVDRWGTFVSGAAPIISNGKAIAVIGVDIETKDLNKRAFYKMVGL